MNAVRPVVRPIASYFISIHSVSGAQVERFGDFLTLESRRVVNGVGELRFSLPEGHPALANLSHLSQIRLYRRRSGSGAENETLWQLENQGLLLKQVSESGAAGRGVRISFSALHPNWLLAMRCVAWKAGIDERSHFNAPAETIAKALLRWNATQDATALNGRERDGQYTPLPISVQSDAGTGSLLNWHCAYENLLESMQRLSVLGGGDFELVPVESGVAATYEFRWYDGQLGSDRRAEVLFALPRGNLSKPRLAVDRSDERSAAVVGGRGVGLLRQVVTCYGENYSTANDLETFVYGLQASAAEGLAALGEQALQRSQPQIKLDFEVLQMPACAYGIHYQLGDRVSVQHPFTGEVFSAKVSAVQIRLDSAEGERITITLEANPAQAQSTGAYLTAELAQEDGVDAGDFTLEEALFALDAGALDEAYLTDGISGGGFAPLP